MVRFIKNLCIGALALSMPMTIFANTSIERDVVNDSYKVSFDECIGENRVIRVYDNTKNIFLSYTGMDEYIFMLNSDDAGEYFVSIGSESGQNAENVGKLVAYSTHDKNTILFDFINNAADVDELKSILLEKAEELELNQNPYYSFSTQDLSPISDSDMSIIASAIFNNGIDYVDLESFYKAFYNAKAPIVLNNAENSNAGKIGEMYKSYFDFSSLKGYDLISDNEDGFYAYYVGKDKKTMKSVHEAFGEYAFLYAISNAKNYQQILDIFNKYSDFITFDNSDYNKSDKVKTAIALLDRKYESMNQLESAIHEACVSQSKPPAGGSGGGGKSNSKVNIGTVANENIKSDVSEILYHDLSENHWAYDTIKKLTERKVINGDSSGNFRPNDNVTRFEFAKMLVSAFGLYNADANVDFVDITTDHWAYKYVASLAQSGIVNGIDEYRFGGNMLISRQDMSVMISRALHLNSEEIIETKFNDNSNISSYAVSAIKTLSEMNIISGYEDNTYRPFNNANRAEAATLIYRSLLFNEGDN